MARYVLRRMVIFVPSLLLISIITFIMVRTAGGDPASLRLGLHSSQEALDRMRREMGLSDPWPVQYGRWFAGAVRGDLGRSYLSGSSVTGEIVGRLPATLELAAASLLAAVPCGIIVGAVSALRRRTAVDRLTLLAGLVGTSIPTFWLGIVLIIVFATWAGWFPVAGSADVHLGIPSVTGFSVVDGVLAAGWPGFWDAVRHLALPALTLALWPAAILARQMRSSLLDVLQQDYARTARAKGLGRRRLLVRHALPNALIPVVTVVALETGYLLGGAVITETVFAWPGIGNLTIQALSARDYMLVQGAVLLFAAVFAVLNITADVLYAVLDPRIHY